MSWARNALNGVGEQPETICSNDQRTVKPEQWRMPISPSIQKPCFDTTRPHGKTEINNRKAIQRWRIGRFFMHALLFIGLNNTLYRSMKLRPLQPTTRLVVPRYCLTKTKQQHRNEPRSRQRVSYTPENKSITAALHRKEMRKQT